MDKFYKQKIKEYKPREYAGLVHLAGLPIPENVPCLMLYMDDRLLFLWENKTVRLNLTQIQNMAFTFEFQTQDHLTSSIGSAVVGGMLAGPIGAAIGGRTKKRQTTTHKRYLIIEAADGQGQPMRIILDATVNKKADAIIKIFNKRPKQEAFINL